MKSKLTEKQEILTQVALPPENEQIVLCDTARNIRLLQNAIENLAHDLEEYKPRPPYIMKKAKCVYILAKIIATKEDLVSDTSGRLFLSLTGLQITYGAVVILPATNFSDAISLKGLVEQKN